MGDETSIEDLVVDVVATGLVAVFPWLGDEPAAWIFRDAMERRGLSNSDITALVTLAVDMSTEEDFAQR